jgi:3-oxoacyl-[acyl-carrier protein] reductase
VTINNLLPERIDTDRQVRMAEMSAAINGITIEDAYAEIRSRIPAARLGRPDEVGAACVFLCGSRSGFITGQNLQLDGGAYPGLF